MSIDLYLVRHGAAQERSPEQPDARRGLTREGAERLAREVEGLARLGVRLDALLHSPLLRAVESAELLTPLLEGRSAVSPWLALAPSVELLAEIEGESVALVGHEPWMSELAAWLATGDRNESRALCLRKGAVACLRGEARPGAMVLRALFTPGSLRRIAG